MIWPVVQDAPEPPIPDERISSPGLTGEFCRVMHRRGHLTGYAIARAEAGRIALAYAQALLMMARDALQRGDGPAWQSLRDRAATASQVAESIRAMREVR